MPRTINRLSPGKLKSLTAPGRYADGGGLYLLVRSTGARSWTFKFSNPHKGKRDGAFGNRVTELGLGSFATVSLARARKLADEKRKVVEAGRDPVTEKAKERRAFESQDGNLFGPFADQMLADISSGFKNEKHKEQWRTTFTAYCAPIRAMRMPDIGVDDISGLLAPFWKATPETASRIRGRIERVFTRAIALGKFPGDRENPASLKIHQAILVTPIAKLKKTRSHPAIPYADMPGFMVKLRKLDSLSARALEFLILTIARTSEVIEATAPEIDADGKLWTIPGERMKAGKEHIVPLVPRALKILKETAPLRDSDSDLIFPNLDSGETLSTNALLQCLKGITGCAGYTVHGMRSAFTDWANDETDHDSDSIEFSLAHVVKSKTRRAYRRATSIEKRRALLIDWEKFLKP